LSYTNTELIKRFFAVSYPTRGYYVDQKLTFDSDDEIMFYNGAVEGDSFKVKSIQANDPTQKSLILQDQDNEIDNNPLVPGSVTVASDSSQTVIYIENVDYIIDYQNGMLDIKEGGALAVGQSVEIWFIKYVLYEIGEDYQVDFDKGTVRRLAGGNIASKETVYLDYEPVENLISDDMLKQAVIEGNSLIEAEIDPDNQFGADPVLQMAATYRTLEIVCHTAAARELSFRRENNDVALAWLKMADKFANRSEVLLRSFHPPYDGPTSPVKS